MVRVPPRLHRIEGARKKFFPKESIRNVITSATDSSPRRRRCCTRNVQRTLWLRIRAAVAGPPRKADELERRQRQKGASLRLIRKLLPTVDVAVSRDTIARFLAEVNADTPAS
jgi:hypothetical protein